MNKLRLILFFLLKVFKQHFYSHFHLRNMNEFCSLLFPISQLLSYFSLISLSCKTYFWCVSFLVHSKLEYWNLWEFSCDFLFFSLAANSAIVLQDKQTSIPNPHYLFKLEVAVFQTYLLCFKLKTTMQSPFLSLSVDASCFKLWCQLEIRVY